MKTAPPSCSPAPLWCADSHHRIRGLPVLTAHAPQVPRGVAESVGARADCLLQRGGRISKADNGVGPLLRVCAGESVGGHRQVTAGHVDAIGVTRNPTGQLHELGGSLLEERLAEETYGECRSLKNIGHCCVSSGFLVSCGG
ncbi:hypothetical protein ACP70R_038810 [Stipagrostis hirtigluma subsp. patula]